MATKHSNQPIRPRRKSKRERRMKIAVYVMVIAMLLSSITYGLAIFI